MNPLYARNPTMVSGLFTQKEEDELLKRIHNWRRHWRPIQRIMAVAYYTPPPAGDVMQSEIIVKLPTNMRDAFLLEDTWRELDNGSAYKWFIKWKYIQHKQFSELRRMMKRYGEKLRTQQEHDQFNKRALEHFYLKLNK